MAAVATANVAIPSSLLPIILDSPAASTPAGDVPNFIDPPNLHVYMYVTLALGLAFTTAFLAARIYTKAVVIQSIEWDDYTIVLGWMLFVAFCGEIFVCVPGVGLHLWDETVGNLITTLYSTNNAEILYVPAILFVKLSILLQYLRIFTPTRSSNPVMWWGLQCTFWTNVIFYIIEMFFDIFTCQPRALVWDPLLNGWCWDIHKQLMSIALFNLISDVIILLLPQYSIWRLHMARRRKLGVSLIFGLGLLACVVTAVRVQSTVLLIQTNDVSWYLAQLGLWAIAELSIAIICSCLPTMPKLYQFLRRKFKPSISSSARTPKSISKGTSASESSERPAKSYHMHWLPSMQSETDERDRNAPQHVEHNSPIDPRSLPTSSQRFVAEHEADDRIPRAYQMNKGIIPIDRSV